MPHLDDHVFYVPKVFTQKEVSDYFTYQRDLSSHNFPQHICFNKCAEFDTSLVALMIDWLVQSKNHQTSLVFSGCPSELIDILQAYDVLDIFKQQGVLE